MFLQLFIFFLNLIVHPIFIFQLSFQCLTTSYPILHVRTHTDTLLFCSVRCNRWWVVQHDAFPLWNRFISAIWQLLCYTPAHCTTVISLLLLLSSSHCIPLICFCLMVQPFVIICTFLCRWRYQTLVNFSKKVLLKLLVWQKLYNDVSIICLYFQLLKRYTVSCHMSSLSFRLDSLHHVDFHPCKLCLGKTI